MSQAKLFIVALLVTLAACASAPQTPVVKETVSEPAPTQTKAEPLVAATDETPKGEISLDSTQAEEVDLGMEGSTSGPVVVDRVVTESPDKVAPMEGMPAEAAELEAAVLEEMKKLEEAKKAADAKSSKKKKKTAEPTDDAAPSIVTP